jgi:hypothetical protein
VTEELDAFVPAQGRTVVFGFRNPAAWETAEDHSLKQKENFIGEPFIYRPAQIVRVWTTDGMKTVNLVVFVDGGNDASLVSGASADNLTVWKTSATIADETALSSGREHYLPRVPAGYTGS